MSISRLERGVHSDMRASLLLAIADATGTSLDWIATGRGGWGGRRPRRRAGWRLAFRCVLRGPIDLGICERQRSGNGRNHPLGPKAWQWRMRRERVLMRWDDGCGEFVWSVT